MAGIRTALDGLVANLEALSITLDNGDTLSLAKVHKYAPDRKVAMVDGSVVNSYTFPEQDNNLAQDVHRYTLTSSWYINQASITYGADLVALWWEAWLTRWAANQRLPLAAVSTILAGRIRADDPMVGTLEWGGLNFTGMTTHLDVQIERA